MPEISQRQLTQLKSYVAELGDVVDRLAGQRPQADHVERIARLNRRMAVVLEDIGMFSSILAVVRQETQDERTRLRG